MSLPEFVYINIGIKSEVEVSGFYLVEKDIQDLVTLLNNHPNIKTLILIRDNLNKNSALSLGQLKHVRKLDVTFNNIGDEIMPLITNSSITNLILRRNGLTNKGAELICKYAQQTTIDIEENQETTEEWRSKVNNRTINNSEGKLRNMLLGVKIKENGNGMTHKSSNPGSTPSP